MGLVASDKFSFATSGSVFDLGSSPEVGDYDLIGVNSDTTVSTPSGFTLLDSSVVQQGSYLLYRLASGGEGSTVTFTTSGDHEATAVWARVRGANGIDVNAKAVATSSSSGTTPTATTGALAETGELAIAYAALHRYAGSTPTSPVWSNGFTHLQQADQGSGNPACTAMLAYKEGVGTSAVSVDVSWTNGAFDRDQYVVTFTIDSSPPQEVSLTGIASAESMGSPAVVYNQTITASGIASSEAFGSSLIANGARRVLELQGELNRIAGTDGYGCAKAANIIAGTDGLEVVGALNTYVGNARINWKDLQGVANQMAGTDGLGTCLALSYVDPV